MLLRPLFFTSFLIDDQLDDEGLATAGPVIVSSASSKTSIAAAFLLAQRDGRPAGRAHLPGSVEFVEGLGIYGRASPTTRWARWDGPATYVDVSGDGEVRQAVHSHYGEDSRTAWPSAPRTGRRWARGGRAARAGAEAVLRSRSGRQALQGLGPGRA